MNIAYIKKEVKEIVELKNNKRAFFLYKNVVEHMKKSDIIKWDEFSEAIRPLIDLYKIYGKNNNYGLNRKLNPEVKVKSKVKSKHKKKRKR